MFRPKNLIYERIDYIADFLRIPRPTAKLVRKLADMGWRMATQKQIYSFLEKNCPRAWKHLDTCYHAPKTSELVMMGLDELIDGFGVDLLTEEGEPSPLPSEIPKLAEYINTGDTYNPTIIYYKGKFSLGTMGDWVEAMERE
jgi:hypothetical protein